jgi:hypothetical protein
MKWGEGPSVAGRIGLTGRRTGEPEACREEEARPEAAGELVEQPTHHNSVLRITENDKPSPAEGSPARGDNGPAESLQEGPTTRD